MKKLISAVLSAAILIGAASIGINAFAGKSLDVYRLVYSEDGYSYNIIDKKGNDVTDMLRSSSASKPAKGGAKRGASLPSSYSSADALVLPDVKNQGNAGCCWAFAALTALEADAVSKGYMNRNEKRFSPSHLTWFTHTLPASSDDSHYGEGLFAANPYMTGGNYVFAGSTLSEWSGIADLNDYPYFPYYIQLMNNLNESGRYDRGSGFILDDVSVLEDTDEIKSWIMEHGVCTAAIYYDSSFENASGNAYYAPAFTDKINHNVSLVGWDDNYPASNFLEVPPSDGAWLVMDSWGTSNHNRGFYWLSYDNPDTTYTAGFALRQSREFYRNYSYNGAPFEKLIGNKSMDISFANIFTADGFEKISAVSFWTYGLSDSITVDVYQGVNSSPVRGNPASSETLLNVPGGYHTVDLSLPVNVSQGTKFSVVISIHSDDSEVVIPVEGIYTESEELEEPVNAEELSDPEEEPGEEPEPPTEGVCFISSPGQSFVYNGVSWDDVGEDHGNLYIQAYSECRHPYESVTVSPTCTLDGYTADICPQCGKEYSRIPLPATGHTFGEWSEYTDGGPGYYSRRYCSVCGEFEERYYSKGTNHITIDRLLEIIFERIISAISSMFTVRRR